jgi:hypothetical protein
MSRTSDGGTGAPGTDKPPKRASRSRKPTPEAKPSAWIQQGPHWIAAVAALLTTVIAGLGLFIGLQARDDRPATEPTTLIAATTTPFAEPTRHPTVELGARWLGPSSITVEGTYADLMPASEAVMVVIREAANPDQLYGTVQATLEPVPSAEIASGSWTASLPITSPGYEITAVVLEWRRGSGFEGGALDEIREHGPDASPVIARSPTEPLDAQARPRSEAVPSAAPG